MSLLSLIALVFGTLGVWLTIRQTIWCWPVSLVAVIASISEFYKERLYGDMSLQVFYLFAGIYGWVYWHQQKSKNFKVEVMPSSKITILVALTIVQSVAYYYVLLFFGGDKPVMDAILTACSLTATYMMTQKWVQNWSTWVIIDLAYVVLYASKEMWLFGVLYFIFATIAFYGWLKWRQETL